MDNWNQKQDETWTQETDKKIKIKAVLKSNALKTTTTTIKAKLKDQ